MTLQEKIKQLRIDKNLTLEEVGIQVGITKQSLYKYETGIVTNIPISNIEKLAIIYNVSPAYLMGWEELDNKQDCQETIDSIFERIELNYNKLNRHGQTLLAAHSDLLVASGEYAALSNSDNKKKRK